MNHPEYHGYTAVASPGVQLLIGGRNITSFENWVGTPHFVLGNGENSTLGKAS